MFRLLWPWLALVLVGLGAAWLRYDVIEAPALVALCTQAPPWWCAWRQAVVLGFLHNVYGVVAVVLAVLAWWRHSRVLAWLAAALGLLALELYNVEPGAVALLVGCLRLVHLQARAKVVTAVSQGVP